MDSTKHLTMNLHLFDGTAAADGGTAAAGDGGAKGETKGTVPGNTRRGKTGEFQGVVFGKQQAAAEQPDTATQAQSHDAGETKEKTEEKPSDSPKDRRKAFWDMVNGEYKDIFTEETQRIINTRYKENRALENQVQEQKPLIDMLMQRYKIEGGDLKKLSAAIENDDAYWSEAAEEAGMSVEQFKEFQQLKRDNAALLADQRGRKQQEARQQQAEKWFAEAQEVKAKFPKFDLSKELQDPNFTAMLRSGTPVEHAYKVLHFDELMTDAMQFTTATTEKRVVDNIRARGSRPNENGVSSQSAFTVRDDVHKLTKKERAEIARRASRGEQIGF